MNTLTPRMTRTLFVSGIAMMILSLLLSMFNVATVLSAPRFTIVGVPSVVGFEGFLADQNGQPLANGSYSIAFRVYDVATGGTALWTETQPNVQVTNGLYAVTLGSITAFSTNTFDGNRWVGVTVGTGTELTPRTRVSSVPFALNASNANTADVANSANTVGGKSLTGMIALFDALCPSGWSEVTSTRGRVVVGLPNGGTMAGTIGTSLTNLEDRTHTHTIAHTHTYGPNAYEYTPGNGDYPNYAGVYGSPSTSGSSNANSGTASTSNIIPYIQLIYCKLNQ